jgi:bifunctional polynucleotide phosphatase/kinase
LFAINLGVEFFAPEDHFLPSSSGIFGAKPKPAEYEITAFDPRPLAGKPTSNEDVLRKDGKPELVVMVGYPGSGKSHFCATRLVPAGYVVANRDTLGSWQKCVKTVEDALDGGKSVVVDNTNGEADVRKRYVDVAKRKGAPVRCFVMDVSREHAMHNNRVSVSFMNWLAWLQHNSLLQSTLNGSCISFFSMC